MPPAQDLGRSSILEVLSYELDLDLTSGSDMFSSRTEIRFRRKRAGAATFADLQAVRIRWAVFNGADLDLTSSYDSGRLELTRLADENTLIVEADFSYTSASAGLRRVTGPDGSACVYSKAYPAGAPRIYCCFDEADLRAPFTVSVRAPAGWSCLANQAVISRPADGDAGWWKFAATLPITPCLSSFCAGPYSGPTMICEQYQGPPLPVTVNALPPTIARLPDAGRSDVFQQPLRYYESALGTAYPYGKCDFVFVPDYPGLAFGAPGLVTVGDKALTRHEADKTGLYLATVIAHEMAHAWFGGLVDICRNSDAWLIEPITTYISRNALEKIHSGAAPWTPGVSQDLPDHAYASDAATVKQLEDLIGRQAVVDGLRDLLRRHAHGCATKDDLVHCWSLASGRDLRQWATDALNPTAKDDADEAT